MLIPQIPTPFVTSHATEIISTIISVKAMLNPASQPTEIGRVNTIDAILFVTEP
jgi:hypothetical protein